MRALAVTPRQANSARVIEVDDPRPGTDEVLVRGIRLGLCGTDDEINEGRYGRAPEGSEFLILGHESFGRVERGAAEIAEGTYVVGMVRHPDECPNCRRGEPDMCLWGTYTEHGIVGRHGFGSEWWVDTAAYLVPVPLSLADTGVLLEPTTVVEKAIRQGYTAQKRMFWDPQRAIVAGAGPIGILGALLLRLRGLAVMVFERQAKPDRGALLERAGIGYQATSVTPLDQIAAADGPLDLALEATGSAQVAFDLMGRLGRNGVLALTSVSGGDDTAMVAVARLNRELVLGNRIVLGSVNANRLDYDSGVRDLQEIEGRWPGLLGALITRRVPLAEAAPAVRHDPRQIKVVVELQ